MQMQLSYNEAHAKIESDQYLIENYQAANEETSKAGNDKKNKEAPVYGDDNYKYQLPDFPSTHDDLSAYNKGVEQRIKKKYETLIKNVHFYLCYLFLEVNDYRNSIKHGEILRTYSGRLSTKTTFTVL